MSLFEQFGWFQLIDWKTEFNGMFQFLTVTYLFFGFLQHLLWLFLIKKFYLEGTLKYVLFKNKKKKEILEKTSSSKKEVLSEWAKKAKFFS